MTITRKVAGLALKCIPDSFIRIFTDWIGMLIRIEVTSQWNGDILIPLDQRLKRLENSATLSNWLNADGESSVAALEKINVQFLALAEKLEYAENLPRYPLLRPEEYKTLESRFHSVSSNITKAHFDLLADSIGSEGRVLEFGCGKGDILKRLARHNRSIKLVGVDLISYEDWEDDADGIEFIQCDGVQYIESTTDASFQGVFLLHVVEHLNNLQLRKTVESAFRALAPGGRYVIETPNVQSTFTLTRYYFIDPTHLEPRHPALYCFLLESVGFIDVELIFLDNHEKVLENIDVTTKRFFVIR